MRKESAETVAKLIRQVDAVLVGAGSGLSSAAGYNHYHRNAVFEASGQKLLLLELGVGDMTPSVIKLPFWNMTAKFPDTFLVTINPGKGQRTGTSERKVYDRLRKVILFFAKTKNRMQR